jgi:hypothetical protein
VIFKSGGESGIQKPRFGVCYLLATRYRRNSRKHCLFKPSYLRVLLSFAIIRSIV